MNDVTTLGIDVGKNRFHVIGTDRQGRQCFKQQFTRTKLMDFIAQHAEVTVGMEACSGTHHLARRFDAHGHDVRLLPAQYVKPYVKTDKTDFGDAAAIAEAAHRPDMRFAAIKSVEQQDLQAMLRLRKQLIDMRTAIINSLRALLLERGIAVAQGRSTLERALPAVLSDDELDDELSSLSRQLLNHMRDQWRQLDEKIEALTDQLEAIARSRDDCRLLMGIPGIGPIGATAIVGAFGNAQQFKRAREFAAGLGLVPREHTTGGRQRLFGISKRGNPYVREVLIQGARACVNSLRRERHQLGGWITAMEAKGKHHNVVSVALANKLARLVWKVLTTGEPYEPMHV